MNRWDEIRAEAVHAADLLTPDPAVRDAVANHLIRLTGLMVQAAGKGVAIDGESAMNDIPDEDDFEPFPGDTPEEDAQRRADFAEERRRDVIETSTAFRVGEQMQDGARVAVRESLAADLSRYEAAGLRPVWTSQRATYGLAATPAAPDVRPPVRPCCKPNA